MVAAGERWSRLWKGGRESEGKVRHGWRVSSLYCAPPQREHKNRPSLLSPPLLSLSPSFPLSLSLPFSRHLTISSLSLSPSLSPSLSLSLSLSRSLSLYLSLSPNDSISGGNCIGTQFAV